MKHSEAVKLLFLGWQSQADALRPEAAGLYLTAAANFTEADVTVAVHELTQGRAAGLDPRWLPSSAAFGDYCRTVRNRRLDEEARNRPRLAPPPPPSREEMETWKEFIARLRAEGGGLILKRIPSDLYITPAEHEAAKARAIKEALEAHRADIILRAADGDPAAIAEWREQNEADGIAKKEIAA
jgi:hypothetical protein